jgi:hypothetical protein
MQARLATIESVSHAPSDRSGVSELRFTTRLENGSAADHCFPGLEGDRLLKLAGVSDISALEGMSCVVMIYPKTNLVEWYGFSSLLDVDDLVGQKNIA